MNTKNKKTNNKQRVIANRRIFGLTIILSLVVSLVISNVLYIMITGIHYRSGKSILEENADSGLYVENIIASRGTIYDRDGGIIAQDIEAYNLYAIIDESRTSSGGAAAYVTDYEAASEIIGEIIDVDSSIILSYLNDAKASGLYQTEFGNYGKELTAQQKEDLENSGITGLGFSETIDRVYPISNFASQLIGYAQYSDEDGKISGVMGMELYFDEELSGTNGQITYQTDSSGNYIPNTSTYTQIAENGNDIYLTLDQNVQTTVETALANTMTSNDAQAAWCIVMEADTGKILAQAGYPSFDLNERDVIDNFLNLPSQYIFEPGSVMKPFVYVAAMEEGVYPEEETFLSGTVYLGADADGTVYEVSSSEAALVTIKDAMGKQYGYITYDEGIIRSTNTAIVHLLLEYLEPSINLEYLDAFGFFDPVNIYGVYEQSGMINIQSEIDQYMLGFGQGSSITAYQLVRAARAIFTDGCIVEPYIVEKIVDPNTNEVVYQAETIMSESMVSDDTLTKIQTLLEQIVTESYGTAHNYEMSDITLMAKTGTGEIYVDGGYSEEIWTTSILAAAPSEDPEIIIYYGFQSANIQYYETAYFQDIVREALLAVDSYTSNNSQTTSNSESAVYTVYTMPSLINHSFDYINEKLDDCATSIYYIGDGSSVIEQYPSANTETISTQKVFLLTDSDKYVMLDMSGWSRKDIVVYCEMIGISVTFEGSGYASAQSISEGELLTSESVLTITLS